MNNRYGTTLRFWAGISGILALASSAQAFNPNEGATAADYLPTDYSYHNPKKSTPARPQRSYTPPSDRELAASRHVPAASSYQPAPVYQQPTPQPIAYTPPAQPAPIAYQQPAPIIVPPAPAIAAEPAPIAYHAPAPAIAYTPVATPPAAAPAAYSNAIASSPETYSFGLEVFYDNYQEPETFPELNVNGYYAALSAGYNYDFDNGMFTAMDGRIAFGKANYSSRSGEHDGAPQLETDLRWTAGYNLVNNKGSRLRPYIGIAHRYFVDSGEGEVTTLGAGMYDRKINQIYAPVGITYEFLSGTYQFAPTIEYDHLIYGHVRSKLQQVNPFLYDEFSNNQHKGYGLRGEFLVGQTNPDGSSWQFGPFVRYWNVDDSELDSNWSGTGMEPMNERWQLGAKFKYLY
jgi:hypothetical protein